MVRSICTLLAVTVTGCGSVQPSVDDASPLSIDGKIAFADDEDGDSIPDESDNCPWLASIDQADDDSDHVGNICDPSPSYQNKFTFFSLERGTNPFTRIDAGWTPSEKGWFFNANTAQDSRGVVELPFNIADAKITIGVAVLKLTNINRKIAIALQGPNQPAYFYGEILQFDAVPVVSAVVTYVSEAGEYTNLELAQSPQPFPTDNIVFSLDVSEKNKNVTVSAKWSGLDLVANAQPSNFSKVQGFRVELFSLEAELRFIAVVE